MPVLFRPRPLVHAPPRAGRPARRARAALGAAAVGCVLAAAGCDEAGDRESHGVTTASARLDASDTLYIGATSVSTGGPRDSSVLGSVQLAVARLNAERPAGAPPLGVRMPVRGGGRGRSEVRVAATLRDDPRVMAVVGPTGSAAALDDAPVFGDLEHGGAHAVAALLPTATNSSLDRISPWVFRICPSDDDAAAALARFAAESLGVRRVAVVFRNDVFGRGFARRMAAEFAARGVEVTERDPYLADATRYDAYAARIARSGADGLLVAGHAAAAQAVVHAVHAAGARPAVLGTDDMAAVAAHMGEDPALRGLRYVSFFDTGAPGQRPAPAAAAFAAAYRARFGHDPDHRAALSYDAAMLAGRAVHAAAGGAPAGDAWALRHRVRDAIARVGRTAPPFQGVAGEVRFGDTNGATGRRVWIGRVGA